MDKRTKTMLWIGVAILAIIVLPTLLTKKDPTLSEDDDDDDDGGEIDTLAMGNQGGLSSLLKGVKDTIKKIIPGNNSEKRTIGEAFINRYAIKNKLTHEEAKSQLNDMDESSLKAVATSMRRSKITNQ